MKKIILITLIASLLINGLIIGRGYVKAFNSLLQQQEKRIEMAMK